MKEIRSKNSNNAKKILNFCKNSAIIFFVQSVGTASIHNFPVLSSDKMLKGNGISLA